MSLTEKSEKKLGLKGDIFLVILARSNFDHYTKECKIGILKKKKQTKKLAKKTNKQEKPKKSSLRAQQLFSRYIEFYSENVLAMVCINALWFVSMVPGCSVFTVHFLTECLELHWLSPTTRQSGSK